MNALIIGGTGHVGGRLARDLVVGGRRVACVSHRRTDPYLSGRFRDEVRRVSPERRGAEKDGTLADPNCRPAGAAREAVPDALESSPVKGMIEE